MAECTRTGRAAGGRRNQRRRPCLELLESRNLQATRILLSNAGPIIPFEGSEFRGAIAKFTAINLKTGGQIKEPLAFGGEVNWADSTTTKIGSGDAWVESNPRGGFFLMGRHTWKSEKPGLKLAVNVTTMDGSASTSINASVRDAPKSIRSQPVTMGPGLWHLDAPVARFTDTNPNSDINEFQANITYTDPSTRRPKTIQGKILRVHDEYIVYTERAWGRKGTFNLRIQVTEVGGSTLNTTGQVREL